MTVDYNWQINNRYAGTGLDFGGLAPAFIAGTQTNAHNGRVYITDYTDLGDDSELDDSEL